jgi:superkiller protein 3
VYVNLGRALGTSGKTAEAVLCYQEVVRLDSRNSSAHLDLARALASIGKFDEAITQCKEALRLDPENPTAMQLLQALIQQRPQ